MAKGVDLTSKEWCDLVFEGKIRSSAHTSSVRKARNATG